MTLVGKHSQLTPAADLRLHSNCSDTTVPLECIFLSLFQSVAHPSLSSQNLGSDLQRSCSPAAQYLAKNSFKWQAGWTVSSQTALHRFQMWALDPQGHSKILSFKSHRLQKECNCVKYKRKTNVCSSEWHSKSNQIKEIQFLSICCKNKLIIAYTLIYNVIKLEFLNIYFKLTLSDHKGNLNCKNRRNEHA